MRVLFYNWVDVDDPAGRGGGVRIYQRTVMEEIARRPGVDAWFLSAGLAHSLRPGPPRWEELRHGRAPARRFRLVDGRPLAPSHHSFGDPAQIDHPETVAAFADFVETHGPFDAIQFDTLEGLPARVLALAERWPRTRFVVVLHNHYPVCPQVNLWHRERAHCADFEGGGACTRCLPFRPDPDRMRRVHAAHHALEGLGCGPGTAVYDDAVRPSVRAASRVFRAVASRARAGAAARPEARAEAPLAAPRPVGAPALFAARRAEMVRLINAHADRVIAVSERTAEIAAQHGIARERLAVRPIGTDQAERWHATAPPARLPRADGTLGVAFLGYARPDKGFPFLLDALEGMAPVVLRRLRLTLAAALRDRASRRRLDALAPRLASFRHFDGYARGDLDRVLAGVDLGLVPGLWEDPLPQVALEMHARRIPLLTSDRGGARELGRCPALVFPAGDAAAFAARLAGLLEPGLDLAAYWAGARPPVSPADHVDALLRIHAGETDGDDAPAPDRAAPSTGFLAAPGSGC
jgi:glycosyltransferase involved in cell wall biosynthesis